MVSGPVDLPFPAPLGGLSACGIRQSCRWYFQRGAAACAGCPLIVAGMGGTGTCRGVMAKARGHAPGAWITAVWQAVSRCCAPAGGTIY
jgi:hypothetical protein